MLTKECAPDLPERILRKIVVLPGGCWHWTGARDGKGYGFCWWGSAMRRAHRVVWEILAGRPVEDGLQLDHLCRNRSCVNPAHLEPVTNRENQMRGLSFTAINAAKTMCVNGHPFADQNLYIHPNGMRVCRTCRAAANRKYRRSRRAVAD